jgi:hypothetical protein
MTAAYARGTAGLDQTLWHQVRKDDRCPINNRIHRESRPVDDIYVISHLIDTY